MLTTDIHFLNTNYTWLQFTLMVFGTAIGLLMISTISRIALYTYKNQLLLEEIQKDMRKLVLLNMRNEELRTPSPEPGDVPGTKSQQNDPPV